MAVNTRQVALSTSPTLLVQADSDGCTVYLHVQNTVYLGAAGVTTSTGLRLDSAAGPLVIQLRENDALYAVVGSGTPTVTLMTVGN
jgi:hypothetical protein